MFKEEIINIQTDINNFKGQEKILIQGIQKKLDRSTSNYFDELMNTYNYLLKKQNARLIRAMSKEEKNNG